MISILSSYHNSPEFTQGGSNEAEIATPTKEEVLRPEIANATPTPEGSATKNPRLNCMHLHDSSFHLLAIPARYSRGKLYPGEYNRIQQRGHKESEYENN